MDEIIKKLWESSIAVQTNLLKLALPYWMIKDLDHVVLLKFFISTLLVIFGYGTLTEGLGKVPELVTIALVLISFAAVVAGLIYSLVPCPSQIDRDPATREKRLKDIGILSLSICFVSTFIHEILRYLGLLKFLDPARYPKFFDFLQNTGLNYAWEYASSIVAVSLTIGILLAKNKINDCKQNPSEWTQALTLRSLGPLVAVLMVFNTFVVKFAVSE